MKPSKLSKASLAPSRLACILLPNFALEVCLRAESHLAGFPVVLIEGGLDATDAAEIIAVNRIAADSGVLIGMTVAQARIVCDQVHPVVRDYDREIEQSNRIYKILQRLSPFVEEAAPGLCYLDAAGMSLLYADDHRFAERIIDDLHPVAYPVKVGMAHNKFVARIAAEISSVNTTTVVPPGGEAAFLKPLAIEQAQFPDDTVAMLRDLGLYTIGQVAAFPANELRHRFGPEGIVLSKLSRGEDTAFFAPETPTEDLADTIWLTAPLAHIGQIITHVERLLGHLLAQLANISQGCTTVIVTFSLENKTEQAVPVTVDSPTLSVQIFLRQLRTQLESTKLTAAVNGIRVVIPNAVTLVAEQLSLEGSNVTADTHDRPTHRTVTAVVPRDMLLPEQRFVFSPVDNHPKTVPPVADNTLCIALGSIGGLRLIQPPREITVRIDHRHRPILLQQHETSATGPWELSGGWWHRYFDRQYWELQTDHHQHYLVFYDRLHEKWFIQGVFD